MTPSPSQLSALKWFVARGGDGVFDKYQVLVACGERAPVMRSTWNKLDAAGYVELYANRRRLRVTAQASTIDLSNIEESHGRFS